MSTGARIAPQSSSSFSKVAVADAVTIWVVAIRDNPSVQLCQRVGGARKKVEPMSSTGVLNIQGGTRAMKRIIAGSGLWLFLSGGGFGQVPAVKPEFEVVDIRQNKSSNTEVYERELPSGEFSARNIPMKEYVKFAYHLRDEQLGAGPAWLDTDRFDIDGKTAPGTPD